MSNMNLAQLQALSMGAMSTPGAAAVQSALGSHAAIERATARAAVVGAPGDVNGFRSLMGNGRVLQSNPVTSNTISASTGSQFVNPGVSQNSIQPNSVLWFLRDISQSDQKIALSVGAPGTRPAFIPPGAAPATPSWLPPGAFNPWTTTPNGPVPGIPRPPGGWGGGGGPGGGGGGGVGRPGAPGGPGPGPGPGGGGGWGGGGGRIPFAGMVGLGSTSRLLGAAGLGMLGAEVVEEVASLPQSFASMERSALAGAKPYWDYRQQMAGMAHAGGMSSEDLQHQFYQGVQPPDWMQQLGLGPQQASSLLRGYGILQTGERAEQGNRSVVEELAKMKFIPAFGGLPEGMVENSAANAAKYGAVEPRAGGLREYDAQMVDVLARGTELGLNRASILRSIDSGISMTARAGGGAGVTPETMGNFALSFAGTPAGRTGEAALNALQLGADFAGRSGKEPIPTMAFSSVFSRMHSIDDVKSYINSKSPGAWDEAVRRNPGIESAMQKALTDHSLIGQNIFSNIIQTDFPQVGSAISTSEGPGIMGAPGSALRLMTEQAQSGLPASQIEANERQAAGSTSSAAFTGAQKSSVALAMTSFKAAHYTGAQAAGIVGTDMAESGMNPRAFNPDGGGRGAMGIGQWRGSRITAFEQMFHHSMIDPNIPADQLLREQIQYQQWELSQGPEAEHGRMIRNAASTGDAASIMVNDVQRPGSKAFQETGRATAFANRINTEPDTGGLYPGQLAAQGAGLGGQMAGSQVTAREAGTLIPKLNASIQAMIDGLGRAQAILSSQSVEETTAQMGALN
jgi:hypothetical protein